MKKLWASVMLAVCLSWSSTALAEDVNISSDIGVYSQYLWRGEAQGAGQASVQGDTYIDFNGVEFGAWFATLGDPANTAIEFDLSAVYSTTVSDGVDVSLGYIWYTYSNRGIANASAANNATEVFGEIAYTDYWTPSVAVYYDTTSNDWWLDLGLSGEIINEYMLDLTLSYQKFKLSTNPLTGLRQKSELKTFDITFSKELEINDVAFAPSFTVAFPMGQRKSIAKVKNEFVFGVNFSF